MPPVIRAQARTFSIGTTSPPTIIWASGCSSGQSTSARSFTHCCHSAAGASTTVISCSAQNRSSSRPDSPAGSGWTTSAAPATRAGKMSPTEASKLNGGIISSRSAAWKPCRSTNACARLVRATCGTTTPFGVPVEPEV